MKKLLYLFSICLFVLLFPLPVHAELIPVDSQLPSVIPQNQQLMVMDFSQQAPTAYFNSSGMTLLGDNGFYNVLEVYEDQYDLPDNYKWTVKPISELIWKPSANLYDSNGNLIDPDDASLCYGGNNYGNTYFLFDNSSGDILSIGDSPNSAISTINSTVNNQFWGVVGEIADHVLGSSQSLKPVCFYDEQEKTAQQVEQLLSMPNAFICISNNAGASWYLMTSDVNNEHVYSDGEALYADDIGMDMISYGKTSVAVNGRDFPVSSGNYSFNGRTYNHRLPGLGWALASPFQIDIRPRTTTNQVNNDNSDVVWFKPVEHYHLPDTYNYTYHNTRHITYDNTYNNDYITNEYITTNNYPITTTITNLPDFSPIYNYYNEYYNYYNTPQIGDSLGDQDAQLPSDIPILSNLEKRFPFCIPFDIYKLLKGLSVPRETPYIDRDFTFPVINYTWHIQYDLHDFDDNASLFRTLFLISFIIGLAYWSYSHFFGS